jgi:hypothetical protein
MVGYHICLSSSAWSGKSFQEATAIGIHISHVLIADSEERQFLETLRNQRTLPWVNPRNIDSFSLNIHRKKLFYIIQCKT